jgi:hypothetical protein
VSCFEQILLSARPIRSRRRIFVFQEGTEIAYVESAFKEVKLNRGSPMAARQTDPNARATMLVYFEK